MQNKTPVETSTPEKIKKSLPFVNNIWTIVLSILISISIMFIICKTFYSSSKIAYINNAKLMIGFSDAASAQKALTEPGTVVID